MHALQEGGTERVIGSEVQGGGGRGDWNASAFNGWHSNLYAIELDLLDKANTSYTPNATTPIHNLPSLPAYALPRRSPSIYELHVSLRSILHRNWESRLGLGKAHVFFSIWLVLFSGNCRLGELTSGSRIRCSWRLIPRPMRSVWELQL